MSSPPDFSASYFQEDSIASSISGRIGCFQPQKPPWRVPDLTATLEQEPEESLATALCLIITQSNTGSFWNHSRATVNGDCGRSFNSHLKHEGGKKFLVRKHWFSWSPIKIVLSNPEWMRKKARSSTWQVRTRNKQSHGKKKATHKSTAFFFLTHFIYVCVSINILTTGHFINRKNKSSCPQNAI